MIRTGIDSSISPHNTMASSVNRIAANQGQKGPKPKRPTVQKGPKPKSPSPKRPKI